MFESLPRVTELHGVDARQFREQVLAAHAPVVLRGAVGHWPLVQVGRASAQALVHELQGQAAPGRVTVLEGPPDIDGEFFYTDGLDGLNFSRRDLEFRDALERLLELRDSPVPPALYLQSLPLGRVLPGLAGQLPFDLVDAGVMPRIWIGNRVTVQAHFDLQENLACVVAGRRRFLLFPPEQTPNLYPGPFEFTLAGPPVSMVRPERPDLERFPRFRTALEHAQVAELAPGDALHIPYLWWHHVRALDEINVLVNYWWTGVDADRGSPFDALLHALLAVRDLPAHQRAAWRTLFEHYVFGAGDDPVAHLPMPARGLLGSHSPEQRQRIRMILVRALAAQAGLPGPGPGR